MCDCCGQLGCSPVDGSQRNLEHTPQNCPKGVRKLGCLSANPQPSLVGAVTGRFNSLALGSKGAVTSAWTIAGAMGLHNMALGELVSGRSGEPRRKPGGAPIFKSKEELIRVSREESESGNCPWSWDSGRSISRRQ